MRYNDSIVRLDLMVKRVAVAGFLHETNTFAPSKANLDAFRQGGGYLPLSRGAEITARCGGVNLGISGFLDHADAAGWDIVPLLWCGAIPSAQVERGAFEAIAGEIAERLLAAGPVDGLLLDLHGAMVAEHLDDGEGELLARLRRIVGPDVPISASLDLHGNVTPLMVEAADMLVAFRTYPHVDMAETGRRAAAGLGALMERGRPYAKASRQLPFLIPIPWQCTTIEPAASLYATIEEVEGGAVASASILTGFPAADFPDCRPSILAYGETQEAADAAADRLEAAFLEREARFAGQAFEAEEAVARALAIAKGAARPVVIADTQDNPGAGGDSDTTGLLRALVSAGASRAAMGLIVDREAARLAHEAGQGATLTLALGGRSGIPGDRPFEAEFTVETLSDGRFIATGPYYGGSALALGPSACLSIGGVRIAVTSEKAQLADREMFRFLGIVPEEAGVLVVKSSVHFRADFEPIAEAVIVGLAPGPMALAAEDLPFTRLADGVRLSPCGTPFRPPASLRASA